MTILKSLGFFLLITTVFFACGEDDGFVGPTNSGNQVTSESFEANITLQKLSGSPVAYEPILLLNVQYEGQGTSNLMSNITIESSHIEEVFEDQSDFRIEQGQFELRSENGDMIYGSYQGHGLKNPSRAQLEWSLQIEGGTGRFSTASGTLLLSADDHNPTDNTMQAKISGKIVFQDNS